ncbi:DUF2933 domain-containing protein [Kineosporia sp. R_H_3]|uniref:DUF2933 domain-containing protein n=1 Tax=Kineosporia sp. R_H_3 TaxID=1961848 RepID=UPI0018E93F27|nr:DUF2933 domain-containing protein [Kineosporia sp. R_H_3]
MLVIAVTLVVTGVANAGAIVIALVCTAMMAFMMMGMGHGDGRDAPDNAHGLDGHEEHDRRGR